MAHDDVEAELNRHPAVRECAVTTIRATSGRDVLVAYVVSADPSLDAQKVRTFLNAPKVRSARIPRAVVLVDELPRRASGEVDRDALPLPVQAGPPRGGKGGGGFGDGERIGALLGVAAVVTLLSLVLTNAFWPGSTDVSAVPGPWSGFFRGLYLAESLAFGLGVAFLMFGHPMLDRFDRPRWLTRLAHLAVVWLLASWWPQDNSYRLTGKTDWGSQAALVYGFNITLMVAAGVLVAFAFARHRDD
ncbi:AMP-binding enzyme [Actinomadura rayongensis]|uniref:AMP-binding enzyme C-terminal domain-containing protein n=1 Tax=Actinomadura rayongensis TaxID=1429076 RepID=A0A6I4W065_9ACTN|nr:amino acid adenylation domain-containing protein [Actinomadura rayongensis]MXQ62821.1 hypothetical protein [Actinomadura rayongensis]